MPVAGNYQRAIKGTTVVCVVSVVFHRRPVFSQDFSTVGTKVVTGHAAYGSSDTKSEFVKPNIYFRITH